MQPGRPAKKPTFVPASGLQALKTKFLQFAFTHNSPAFRFLATDVLDGKMSLSQWAQSVSLGESWVEQWAADTISAWQSGTLPRPVIGTQRKCESCDREYFVENPHTKSGRDTGSPLYPGPARATAVSDQCPFCGHSGTTLVHDSTVKMWLPNPSAEFELFSCVISGRPISQLASQVTIGGMSAHAYRKLVTTQEKLMRFLREPRTLTELRAQKFELNLERTLQQFCRAETAHVYQKKYVLTEKGMEVITKKPSMSPIAPYWEDHDASDSDGERFQKEMHALLQQALDHYLDGHGFGRPVEMPSDLDGKLWVAAAYYFCDAKADELAEAAAQIGRARTPASVSRWLSEIQALLDLPAKKPGHQPSSR